ncbi:cysteinyl-tRNA synthetase [Hasllibacter halocynthiae]|uniref:Cysteine--tRNA ligase n=1 Tax=Hasllibacter halocynthiae TaxID=595589 RepID=A0A2T0X8H5_9RHOB|nr:cysteine--tRNA ligase [Hasllibacter halocynthiae]PRY95233.1 cysteinyl-tRNA synthetase [Hasllibacter halocynthiae]
MTTLRLHDSMTGTRRPFVPIDPSDVRLYVCGPTVYDRAHLGNARTAVAFDVLFRLLRHLYGEDHVRYVRNVTDVDDKINARAAETGRPIREITDETLDWYHEDMAALGNLPPTDEPRATDHVPGMIAMIEDLVARGHAYAAEGHVLFAVRTDPSYGVLSKRSVDDMIAGARVEVAPYKRDPMDFVLWKPSDDATPGWDSPWGRGRPGWHIECSAMSAELLGPHFDIHGGGSDLKFPHHENEIAQSTCAHPDEGFANYWLHSEMLRVEGQKMSKSLGNFFTVRDLLETGRHGGVPVDGPTIRTAFLMTRYREPLDFSVVRLHEASKMIGDFTGTLGSIREQEGGLDRTVSPLPEIVEALRNDLDTASALQLLRRRALAVRYTATELIESGQAIAASFSLLGLNLWDHPKTLASAHDSQQLRATIENAFEVVPLVEKLLEKRSEAKGTRDFASADAIRDGLVAAGIEVRDGPGGTEWSPGPSVDRAALKALL